MVETLIQEEKKLITVEEFLQMELEEGFYYELLNGNIVKKQAPSPVHQRAVTNLVTQMNLFVKEKELGEVFASPIDVYFDRHNNTQPDIIFIRKDRDFIITDDGIKGHPDLIVEVLSPSSFKRDRHDKYQKYLEFGVSEYWIIDPRNQSFEVFSLENDTYEVTSFAIEEGEIESKVLAGFKLSIASIF